MLHAKHIKIGKIGEELAKKFLENGGYRIITQNYSQPWGEIDIITKDKAGILVFFEVKTLSGNVAGLLPEDNLTKVKLQKLKKICSFFANKNPELINENLGWRIDLLTLLPKINLPLTNNEKDFIIKHYRNIA